MITEKTIFKGKKLDGYPRLKYTAERISKYIPYSKRYVEPFAGLGEVAKLIQREEIILNDMSDYAINELQSKFPTAIITQEDFITCMKKWDSEDTFYLIDPPWYNDIYSKNDKPFMDRKAIDYYTDIFEFLKTVKGNWILCADKWEHDVKRICTLSEYDNLILKTTQRLLHGKIGVLLTSNIPFSTQPIHSNVIGDKK
jgi:site-specific DNA-adenine methylase